MTTAAPVIEVRDVSVRFATDYGDVHAVDEGVLHDSSLQAAGLRADVLSLHGG